MRHRRIADLLTAWAGTASSRSPCSPVSA